jgi:hypothetical protein
MLAAALHTGVPKARARFLLGQPFGAAEQPARACGAFAGGAKHGPPARNSLSRWRVRRSTTPVDLAAQWFLAGRRLDAMAMAPIHQRALEAWRNALPLLQPPFLFPSAPLPAATPQFGTI